MSEANSQNVPERCPKHKILLIAYERSCGTCVGDGLNFDESEPDIICGWCDGNGYVEDVYCEFCEGEE